MAVCEKFHLVLIEDAAVLTNDEGLGKLAKHLTTQARIPHRWAYAYDRIGYNYRMPNINAAVGYVQLEELPGFVEKKDTLRKIIVRCWKESWASSFLSS